MANEIEIPLKLSGVQSLKAELLSLKAGIADASDPEQMAALAAKAGEVSEKIKDANEQLAEMSKGSSLGKVTEAFHDIKENINSIDFVGATKQMDKFSEASEESAKSLDKGATFAQRYGEELQPLTTRLGEAEDRLYELALAGEKTSQEYQDLLETVSRYRRVQIETDQVVDGASQTMAQKLGGSLGGVTSAFELAQGAAGAFGASGEAIEKSLLKVQSAAAIAQGFQGIKEAIPSIKALSASFKALGTTILSNPIFLIAAVVAAIVVGIGIFLNKIGVLQKVLDFLMIPINALIDGFKELTDWLGLTSYAAEENARTMEKANEKAFKSSEKRTAAISDSYDIEIAKANAAGKDTTKLEIQKSKAISDAAADRLRKAKAEYAEIKKLNTDEAKERRKALRDRIASENQIIKDGSKERKMIQIADDAEEKAAADKAAEERKAKAAENAKAYAAGRAAIQKEIAAANKLVVDSTKTQSQKEIDDTKAKYAALIAEAKKYKQDVTALEAAQSLEINNIRKQDSENNQMLATNTARSIVSTMVDTRTKTLQIQGEGNMASFEEQQKYNEAVIAADESLAQAKLGAAKGLISGLTELAGENKKLANALFLVDKALAIGEIIVNTQKEISGYYANPTWKLLPDGGLALASAAAAGAKIRAATSIGTIVASSISKFMGGGGASVQTPSSGGGGGGGSANVGNSAVPSFVPGNLFGQGNAANNAGAPQSMEQGQNITVTAVVSETEITATQSKVNKIMKNSVL
jgi:hypothetical protein